MIVFLLLNLFVAWLHVSVWLAGLLTTASCWLLCDSLRVAMRDARKK